MDDDTGGALMGSLLAHGLPPEMAIVSDDAGQFNVFRHGLCWIHAERVMVRIIPLNETHRKEQQWVREQIWDLYADLNVYKAAPNEALKEDIEARFEELCAARTRFATLRQALKRFHRNKAELLLVLEKTCRKHGISFWHYLKDRVSGNSIIPRLTEYIRQAAHSRL
jgi:hypothetical protein